MRFEFATATQIVFGPGTLREAGKLARPWGQRALIVTGRDTRRAERLLGTFADAGIAARIFSTTGEPSVATIEAALAAAREHRVEFVVGFGGGSAIDAAKAVAGLLTNPGALLDYLEVIGKGLPLVQPAAPWMAIPTTAGTGAEVTRNAVLSVPDRGLKVSLRSAHLLARVAIVDPELTLDTPPATAAAAGLDALTQLIEAFVCTRANVLTDSLCAAAIPRTARALPDAANHLRDPVARNDLAFGSLSSGLALANAGLGAVHGFAAPLGGRYSAPHGAICAALLAPVMSANLHALAQRSPQNTSLAKYRDIARWVTGREDAVAEDAVAWVRQLVMTLRIPSLSSWGVRATDAEEIVERAQQASSMKANPVALTDDELTAILREAF